MPGDQPLPGLAIAMIVRNAASELRQTLESLGELGRQCAILDTGSTDDTLAIARRFGAAVHQRPWDDNFAAARNALLKQIRADWVLWLDAGELLPPNSRQSLHAAWEQFREKQSARLLPIMLPPAAGQLGGEQIWQVRLHPARQNIRFAGRVRESLDAALSAAGVAIESLEFAIHRTHSEHDPAVRTARAQRNVRLADLSLAEDGPTAETHNCLGEALQTLGDPLRSAHHYHRALELAVPASRQALEASYGLLTCLDAGGPDRQKQLSLCLRAAEQFPLDAQLLVALGGYLQSLGHLPLAMRAFDVAFRHGQVERRLWHLPEIREIAAACAASIAEQCGDDHAALFVLEAAMTTFPRSLRLAQQLIEFHGKRGRRREAERVIAALPLDQHQRQNWQSWVLRLDQAAAKAAPLPRAAATFRKTARETKTGSPES